MSMFGANPMMLMALQAALQGRMPGVMNEEQGLDPRALAQSVGAPVPMGGLPQAHGAGSFTPGAGLDRGPVGSQNGPIFSSGQMQQDDAAMPPLKGGQPGMFAGSQSINNALAANSLKTPAKPFKGMFPGKDWKTVVGQIIPAAINGYLAGGGNQLGMANVQHMNRMREAQQEAKMRAALPQQVGSSMVRQNAQGGYDTLYSEPSDAERYAANLGAAPGSPEWANAIREYRAPAYSPLAMEGKLGLEGARYGYRGALQEDRQAFSAEQQEDRQQFGRGQQEDRQDFTASRPGKAAAVPKAPKTPQSEGALYADIRRRFNKGEPITDREKAFGHDYEQRQRAKAAPKGKAAKAGGSQEPIAKGPDGKEYVVRNGQWVPR